MENELRLEAIRLGENHGYSHLPDRGPWIARKLGEHFTDHEELTVRNAYDGSVVILSKPQGSNLPMEPRIIFGDLIEDIRDFARKENIKVHLYNEYDQLLLSIRPECNIGLYESEFSLRNAYDGKEVRLDPLPHEDDRPICPNCNNKAGLEPAHYHSKTSPWRWVCVGCDYAVSCDTDNKFSPTGELACRDMRRTRATLLKVFSMLWKSKLMEKGHAYKLLKQHFPHKKGERVNFATMSTLQMQRAADFAKGIMEERAGPGQAERANNEMKHLYSAITHEEGEPTYLGDGMYLHPDGRIREY